tara:strand:+ start:933 stop:1766 length:834 start_codon:yes stop_codon:yes gene_type:complete
MSEPKGKTDLTSLFDIQQRYLAGLSQKADDDELINKVNTLETELYKIHNSYKRANTNATDILAHQKVVSDIVEEEKNRLLLKKQDIDNNLVGKKRAIALNDSYQLKQSEFNKIKLIFVAGLAISVLLTIIKNNFIIIPSSIINILIIFTLFICSMYSIQIYLDILSRDKMNFNKLDLPEPTLRTEKENTNSNKENDLLSGMNLYGCVGSYCCSEGTKWDSSLTKCVHDNEYVASSNEEKNTEQFSTIFTNHKLNNRRIDINKVANNSATEYDKYARI